MLLCNCDNCYFIAFAFACFRIKAFHRENVSRKVNLKVSTIEKTYTAFHSQHHHMQRTRNHTNNHQINPEQLSGRGGKNYKSFSPTCGAV